MVIDLSQLRTFVAVAEEQHLTHAAERLSMSQSSASGHVRAIEERIGTPLFLRTNRRLELTHAGKLVAEQAKILLRQEAVFNSFARELRGKIEGKLSVGTSSEPETHVGEILTALRARHPMVTVDLMARPSSGTREGLMSGEMDIGILIGRPLEASFTYHELTMVAYRLAGPVAWKEVIESADWAALAQLPWLTPRASSAYSSMLQQLFGDRGLELNSAIQFDNASVGRNALAAGAGMMLIREDYAEQGQRDGRLAVAPIGRVEIPLSIAYQSARGDDPLIRAFLDAARVPWPDLQPIPQA